MLEFLSDLSRYTLLIVLFELYTDLMAACDYNQAAAIEIIKMIVMVELHTDLMAACDYNQAAAIEIIKMIVMVETVMGGKQ